MHIALDRVRETKNYYSQGCRRLMNAIMILALVAFVELAVIAYCLALPRFNQFYATSYTGDMYAVDLLKASPPLSSENKKVIEDQYRGDSEWNYWGQLVEIK